MTSMYLINPRPSQWGFYHDEGGWVSSPDLAIVTVAAMAPKHWRVKVTEEVIEPVDLDTDAQFVGLTGKTSHLSRMIELSKAFRARGKTVIIGGPFASLDPEALRPHADILVTGEMEDIAPEFFADLEHGAWRDHYEGGRADIRRSPAPRWDLYPVGRAEMGALQTTRGCPFDCEFCDVIQYQGRKQRHKDVDQVLTELDGLHTAGFRLIFLSDDNFSVHRRFAREMLEAIAGWNARHADDPMSFATQASLDIARDPELLDLCVAAGLRQIFVGIETINEASLRETNKKQNLLMPIADAVHRMVSRGIYLRSGLILGFDHDGPEIFSQMYDFLQASPLADLTIGMLSASKGTPLYRRMQTEGRLREGIWTDHLGYGCNFEPARMSREALVTGTHKLARDLFAVDAYERRILNFVEAFADTSGFVKRPPRRNERSARAIGLLRRLAARGADEARMLSKVLNAAEAKPAALPLVISQLGYYEGARGYLDRLGEVASVLAPA